VVLGPWAPGPLGPWAPGLVAGLDGNQDRQIDWSLISKKSQNIFLVGDWKHGISLDFPETVGNFIIPTDDSSIIFQRARALPTSFGGTHWR